MAEERSALIRRPEFSFHWLAELVSFLEKEDLGYLLHDLSMERTSG
ncbi:hypothetical protein [Mucilaginibacter achroorhodeus]|nr:hypothetical protein [Mucilaginibacter achroorhodeus]